MKPGILIVAFALLSFSVSSTIGTFHGNLEKEGPKASYTIGFASDQNKSLDITIPEREGLNISYKKEYDFDPNAIDDYLLREGENLPVKRFSVKITSSSPVKDSYGVPVTLTAFNKRSAENGTSPRVAYERDYNLDYFTEKSSEQEFDGELIDGEEDRLNRDNRNKGENRTKVENKSNFNNQSKENKNNIDSQDESENLTIVLAIGVFLVFGYVFYEAVT